MSGTTDATELTDVQRSEQVLLAVGYRVIPLARRLGCWDLLATDGRRGLILVAVLHGALPADLAKYGVPHGFPGSVKRLVHAWSSGECVPKTLSLTDSG